VVSAVAAVWLPVAAVLTPANVADSEPAAEQLCEVPAEVRFVLGDRHYNTPGFMKSVHAMTAFLSPASMGASRIRRKVCRFVAFFTTRVPLLWKF
jgi:hypothetical protein